MSRFSDGKINSLLSLLSVKYKVRSLAYKMRTKGEEVLRKVKYMKQWDIRLILQASVEQLFEDSKRNIMSSGKCPSNL